MRERQPNLPNLELMCYPTVTPSPFCSALDFNLDGAGKGKMVTEYLEKLLSLLHTLSYLSGSFGENKGFSNREDSRKNGGKFGISAFFSQRPSPNERCSAC